MLQAEPETAYALPVAATFGPGGMSVPERQESRAQAWRRLLAACPSGTEDAYRSTEIVGEALRMAIWKKVLRPLY